jgi:hypothetical protein
MTATKKHRARVPDTPPETLTLDGVLAGGHLETPAGRTRARRPPGSGGQGQAAAAEGSLEAEEEAAIAAASAAASCRAPTSSARAWRLRRSTSTYAVLNGRVYNQRDIENYFSELVSMLGYKPAMRMIEVR